MVHLITIRYNPKRYTSNPHLKLFSQCLLGYRFIMQPDKSLSTQAAKGPSREILETLRADEDNHDVKTPIGSVGFTADDWLTSPVSPPAILHFVRYGLRLHERANSVKILLIRATQTSSGGTFTS
ncbi:hypothetical protein ElyMa_001750100 [Elysia marginata]|uniref:Uncharacterized protein n=1 Tax=Elysia marginata TaxID=1093978 RepID=A0AAV4EAF4_9GAST|nr:hypothetical protein ElyMa_001750100 [Elysia marginata]